MDDDHDMSNDVSELSFLIIDIVTVADIAR